MKKKQKPSQISDIPAVRHRWLQVSHPLPQHVLLLLRVSVSVYWKDTNRCVWADCFQTGEEEQEEEESNLRWSRRFGSRWCCIHLTWDGRKICWSGLKIISIFSWFEIRKKNSLLKVLFFFNVDNYQITTLIFVDVNVDEPKRMMKEKLLFILFIFFLPWNNTRAF